MDPGRRQHLIVIERASRIDDGYTQTLDWENATEVARPWVSGEYGCGAERREAAQERADQTATFKADWNPTLEGVVPTDRLTFDGAAWDITSAVTVGLNRERHLTAVRSA